MTKRTSMNKLYFTIALLCTSPVFAGVISHTDYTAGSVITAAGQNTNENAIVNEFNGNINSANIATGGVSSTNILDGTILNADLNSTLQSTVSFVAASVAYRRPNLQYIGANLVDVENNDPTLNRTCILFPSGQKCVTEDTSSTNKYRRLDMTATANFTSGTEDSGIRSGDSRVSRQSYAVYAVISQINSANFVLVVSSIVPVQAQIATLNLFFTANNWVYLGALVNGSGTDHPNELVKFTQTGPITVFTNVYNSSNTVSVSSMSGVNLGSSSNTNQSILTVITGVDWTNRQVPSQIKLVDFSVGARQATGSYNVTDANIFISYASGTVANTVYHTGWVVPTDGVAVGDTAAGGTMDVDYTINRWIDGALSLGTNPLF